MSCWYELSYQAAPLRRAPTFLNDMSSSERMSVRLEIRPFLKARSPSSWLSATWPSLSLLLGFCVRQAPLYFTVLSQRRLKSGLPVSTEKAWAA
ncbi:hypothetical protein D9M70_636770 [compost metagenome]